MNYSVIRQFWKVVESTQINLLKLSDAELIQHLLIELRTQISLSGEENIAVQTYIGTRTLLIRDLAQARSITP